MARRTPPASALNRLFGSESYRRGFDLGRSRARHFAIPTSNVAAYAYLMSGDSQWLKRVERHSARPPGF